MLQWLTRSLGFSSFNIICMYVYCMYILIYKMKNRVWWDNLKIGRRFRNVNTGGFVITTAYRKYISTGGWHN